MSIRAVHEYREAAHSFTHLADLIQTYQAGLKEASLHFVSTLKYIPYHVWLTDTTGSQRPKDKIFRSPLSYEGHPSRLLSPTNESFMAIKERSGQANRLAKALEIVFTFKNDPTANPGKIVHALDNSPEVVDFHTLAHLLTAIVNHNTETMVRDLLRSAAEPLQRAADALSGAAAAGPAAAAP